MIDRQMLEIPYDAENGFFSVGYDGEDLFCLWCSVDSKKIVYSKVIVTIVGTGNPRPVNLGKFIGRIKNGRYVWHIFVLVEGE